jgi:hypothetical protein
MSPDTSVVLSALLHGGFLLAAALTVPALGPTDDRTSDDTLLREMNFSIGDDFGAPAEREEEDPAPDPAESHPDGHERALSEDASYEGGSLGEPSAPDTDLRYSVQGPADNPDPHVANQTTDRDYFPHCCFGCPPYEGHLGGDPDGPTEPRGRDDSLGNDPMNTRGHLKGKVIGMSLGFPGAGLGLRRLCPTCGGKGNGAFPRDASGSANGGETGTERAAIPALAQPQGHLDVVDVRPRVEVERVLAPADLQKTHP